MGALLLATISYHVIICREDGMFARFLIDDIDKALPSSPLTRPGGSLLIMVGLPGAGKSSIVQQVQKLVPSVVISTDRVRLYVRGRPTYSAAEMMYIYEICYGLVERRLAKGQRVIFDGSNYLAARRMHLFNVAKRHGAPMAIGHIQASIEATRERLARRFSPDGQPSDLSDADWSVYRWMVEAQEPIALPHLVLDTTATPAGALAQELYDYWMRCETDTTTEFDF